MVGISLDNKEDEKQLRDFVAEHKLPWPQFYDGNGRDNPVAKEYGIFQIPTQLLLDREGRLINDRARGETLRTEVGRLFED